MPRTGRPRIEISQMEFEKLCAMQCTENEFCSWFNISDQTLNRWCKKTYHMTFVEIFAIKRGKGFISLRRAGFQLAEKNAAMNIFLSKNLLGMKDNPTDNHSSDNEIKVVFDFGDADQTERNDSAKLLPFESGSNPT